jgi:hypothetical protein
MEKCIFFLFFLLAQTGLAQKSSIHGIVKDKNTGEAILFAHIYLANTTSGTTSNTDGTFILQNIPNGEFTLVCTMVGYEPYTKVIHLLSGKSIELIIKLDPSINILEEIELVDKEDKKWKRKFEKFKRELLGDTPNAEQCEIINPWVVNFEADRRINNITAHADQPLIIQNNALGYKILFLLVNFEKQGNGLFYIGYPSFDKLNAADSSFSDNCLENREETYLGSLRHFFYALINKRLQEEGFLLYKIAGGYENRIFESVEEAKRQHLFNPVRYEEIVQNSSPWGTHTVYIPNALEIIYTEKKWADSPYWDARYQVSRILMNDQLTVTKSGYVFNPVSFVVYGYLSEERLANMLPFEYGLERTLHPD